MFRSVYFTAPRRGLIILYCCTRRYPLEFISSPPLSSRLVRPKIRKMNDADERREEDDNDADHFIEEETPLFRPDENLLQRWENLRRQVDRNDSRLRCIEQIGIATGDQDGYVPHDGD